MSLRETFQRAALLAACVALAACATVPDAGPDSDLSQARTVVVGPSVTRNRTPMDPALACLAQGLRNRAQPVFGISVGDIKDYTGKYSTTEGNTITQGGALMIYSALGKLGDAVRLQERFDTRIAELELAYADRRQLGDGRRYQLEPGKPPVPWVPYYGGTILRSDYYIVGGITELNYNVASGGVEVNVSGVGGKRRTFTMSIGVDLRIVDTRSLVVVKTISLQKQIVGVEVGAGVYRFFGTELIDINAGNKAQEPLQLGVRTTIEQGVVELVSAVAGLDAAPCLQEPPTHAAASPAAAVTSPVSAVVAAQPRQPVASPAAAQPGAVQQGVTRRAGAQSAAPQASAAQSAPAQPTVAPTSATKATPRADAVVIDAPKLRPADTGVAAAANAPDVGVPQNAAGGSSRSVEELPFEVGSSTLLGPAMSAVDKAVAEIAQGAVVTIELLAREAETLPPSKRRELAEQRARAVSDALAARGIDPGRIRISWLPPVSDATMRRHSAGYQRVGTLVVVR